MVSPARTGSESRDDDEVNSEMEDSVVDEPELARRLACVWLFGCGRGVGRFKIIFGEGAPLSGVEG